MRTLVILCALSLFSFSGLSSPVEILSASDPISARPADFATLVFIVVNQGPSTTTFDLQVTLPTGYQLIAPLAPISLAPGADQAIFVTVLVPRGAPAGRIPVVLHATSQTEPAITASATGFLEILATFEIEIRPPQDRPVEPGEMTQLTFHMANKGNVLDRLTLIAESRRGFPLKLQPESLELLPGEVRPVIVELTVPPQATPGPERITVIARSVLSDVEASSTVQFTVLPPTPDAVGGTLFLEVPTSIGVALLGDNASSLQAEASVQGARKFAEFNEINYGLQIANLLEIKSVRFNADVGRLGVTLGDLSFPLSPLMTLSGRGGRLTLRSAAGSLSQATLGMALDSNQQLAVGGNAGTDVFGIFPSLSALVRPARGELLGGVALGMRIPVLGQLALHGALSQEGTTLDRAFLVQSLTRLGDFEFDGQFVFSGSNFLGSPRDKFGLELSQSFNVHGLFLRSHFLHSINNVNFDPTRPTVLDTQLGAAARLPIGSLTSIASQFDIQMKRNPFPPLLTQLLDTHMGVLVTQRLGLVSLSVGFDRRESKDVITSTHVEETILRSVADLRLGPLLTLLRVQLETTRDLTGGAILQQTLALLASARFRLPKADLLVSIERLPLRTTLSAQFSATVDRFAVRAQSSVILNDQNEVFPTFGLSLAFRFEVPMPFLPTLGRLEGFAFIDENENGVRDSGEPGVPGIILRLDGILVRTGSSGFFRSPALRPGTVLLEVQELPLGIVPAVGLPMAITLQAGEVRQVQIPLRQEALVSGLVFHDVNRSGELDAGEEGLADVRLVLIGRVSQEILTDIAGRFTFSVPPGPYTLRVDASTLPKRFRLATAAEVSIEAKVGEVQRVPLGVVGELLIKFAPVANFVFSPQQPKAGETVVLDASVSSDPDGRTVLYEWDFNQDGTMDATGIQTTHVFSAAGSFSVTLRVTDDDGNQNSVTKTVVVGKN